MSAGLVGTGGFEHLRNSRLRDRRCETLPAPQDQASRSSLEPRPFRGASGCRRRLPSVGSGLSQQASRGSPGRWLPRTKPSHVVGADLVAAMHWQWVVCPPSAGRRDQRRSGHPDVRLSQLSAATPASFAVPGIALLARFAGAARCPKSVRSCVTRGLRDRLWALHYRALLPRGLWPGGLIRSSTSFLDVSWACRRGPARASRVSARCLSRRRFSGVTTPCRRISVRVVFVIWMFIAFAPQAASAAMAHDLRGSWQVTDQCPSGCQYTSYTDVLDITSIDMSSGSFSGS